MRNPSLALLLALLMAGPMMAQEEPEVEEPTVEEPEVLPTGPTTLKLKDRFYFGGWLGASFGDVISSAQVAPEVGYIVVPKFHLGGSLVYRYRKDERFDPDLTTTDIGGALYGRYFVYSPFFLQGGVEQLSYDFPVQLPDGAIDVLEDDHTAVLVGPGFAIPMGPRAATYMTFLYDLNYDSEGPNPYDRPWMIRIGVGVGL